MALVVLLRGVNVGGHRIFRPTTLARQLEHLAPVNIGAAGTFVIRRPVGRRELRAELARRLPFDAEIVICDGREILGLISEDRFGDETSRGDVVRFVSVLARSPRAAPPMPVRFPPAGAWLLEIRGHEGRFVFGVYRRQMKAIGYLGAIDRLFGVPATTRNWNTIAAIAAVLRRGAGP